MLKLFSHYNLEDGADPTFVSITQDIVWYAESRFRAALRFMTRTKGRNQKWMQTFLREELRAVLSLIGQGTATGNGVEIPIIIRSLADVLCLCPDHSLPLEFDPLLLDALDAGIAANNQSHLVDIYWQQWWKLDKEPEREHDPWIDNRFLTVRTIPRAMRFDRLHRLPPIQPDPDAQAREYFQLAPAPEVRAYREPPKQLRLPPLVNHQALSKDPACRSCREYRDLAADMVTEVQQLWECSTAAETAAATRLALNTRRATTLLELHEAVIIKDSALPLPAPASQGQRQQPHTQADLDLLAGLSDSSLKWTWGPVLTVGDIDRLSGHVSARERKWHSGYNISLAPGSLDRTDTSEVLIHPGDDGARFDTISDIPPFGDAVPSRYNEDAASDAPTTSFRKLDESGDESSENGSHRLASANDLANLLSSDSEDAAHGMVNQQQPCVSTVTRLAVGLATGNDLTVSDSEDDADGLGIHSGLVTATHLAVGNDLILSDSEDDADAEIARQPFVTATALAVGLATGNDLVVSDSDNDADAEIVRQLSVTATPLAVGLQPPVCTTAFAVGLATCNDLTVSESDDDGDGLVIHPSRSVVSTSVALPRGLATGNDLTISESEDNDDPVIPPQRSERQPLSSIPRSVQEGLATPNDLRVSDSESGGASDAAGDDVLPPSDAMAVDNLDVLATGNDLILSSDSESEPAALPSAQADKTASWRQQPRGYGSESDPDADDDADDEADPLDGGAASDIPDDSSSNDHRAIWTPDPEEQDVEEMQVDSPHPTAAVGPAHPNAVIVNAVSAPPDLIDLVITPSRITLTRDAYTPAFFDFLQADWVNDPPETEAEDAGEEEDADDL
ncbi:hypothetical protein GALMADRAFT_147165 [Galerina marginata CBS 339.88]|uniref:Uncharacterized protein n=1 Tax=Galerina marginata (strain CBS 339.88) TaxID=685588 RepID=A0A067SKT9_GALM3|nr:hypothetical protein GALMADRAFT_147165 [Galerina marginata CBS 339.88]